MFPLETTALLHEADLVQAATKYAADPELDMGDICMDYYRAGAIGDYTKDPGGIYIMRRGSETLECQFIRDEDGSIAGWQYYTTIDGGYPEKMGGRGIEQWEPLDALVFTALDVIENWITD